MELEENIKICNLIDVYGGLLTSKQLEIVRLYYYDNLSLAEIGDILKITRQAVNYSIKQTLILLENFEDKIKFCDKKQKLINLIDSMQDKCIDSGEQKRLDKILNKIKE